MKTTLKVKCEAIQYNEENRPLLEVLLKNVNCWLYTSDNTLYIRYKVWLLGVDKTNWVVVLETGEIMVLTNNQFRQRMIDESNIRM